MATAFVGFSLWYAVKPADTGHPYGHGKIAYFSSGFEGGMIFVASLTILYTAGHALVVVPTLQKLGTGLLIVGGLGLVNLALGLYLVRTGRKHNSLVLVSNGKHVLSDMWTSLGVLVGVGLVWLTDIVWLDPLVAILVGFNLAWTGLHLIWQAYEGLMEKVSDADSQALLAELDGATLQRTIRGYHQVRHRRVNDQVWIEYHLHFPNNLSLAEAHARSHAVEDAVIALFPKDQVIVTAHLEPEAHDEAHPDGHAEPVDPLGAVG
jgi:cation diffusion facilitator family transporter